ncbi:MAG TPA: nuclear transport factor 2 family protein, partial [Flavisolibacter sp.]
PFLLLVPVLLFACNANDATVKSSADSVTTATTETAPEAENVSLPYTVAKTPDWERGSLANVALAMNTLKAYVDKDMARVGQYLADSVEFYTDNVAFKGTRDSLVQFFTAHRSRMDSITIRMHDYESVKSKSRGEEWVGMWYTETNQAKGGAIDSFMVMDDIKIVNGKVAVIDSKGRRLGKK